MDACDGAFNDYARYRREDCGAKNQLRNDYFSSIVSLLPPTIIFVIFWDFLMFYQIFFSPQMKRCAIIPYKPGIYELPHE